jgi:hypothetical protein
MSRIFTKFEEIEQELGEQAPPIVYKYRTWKDENHKSLLVNQQAWLSHPFNLNDPLDVRPEIEFNFAEFEDDRFFAKMTASAIENFKSLPLEERKAKAQNQWEEIKKNPKIVVENLKQHAANSKNFDGHGVFSTSIDDLNEKVWEEYGDHHAGYSVGFKTVEFCRKIKSGYGYVKYSDKPHKYSFLEKRDDDEMTRLYLKKTKWQYENEFRFITVGVGKTSTRVQTFEVETVAEIILGYNISEDHEKEILDVINKKYPKELPIYKTKRDDKGKLIKVRIR